MARKHLAFAFLVCLAVFLFKARNVLNGTVDVTYQGDEGNRIARATIWAGFSANQTVKQFTEDLNAIHPPGDFLFKSLALRFGHLFTENLDAVHVILVVNAFLFSLAAFFLFATGWEMGGVWIAWFTLGLTLLSKGLFMNSVGAMGEMTIIPFVAGSIYAWIYSQNRKWSWLPLMISALLIFLATFVRTETMVVLPGACLYLFFRNGWKRAVAFGSVAGAYVIAHFIAPLLNPEVFSYLNATSVYIYRKYTIGKFLTSEIVVDFIADTSIPFFLLACVGFYLYKKSKTRESTFEGLAAWLISALGVLVFVVFRGLAPSHLRTLTVPILVFIPLIAYLLNFTFSYFLNEKGQLLKCRMTFVAAFVIFVPLKSISMMRERRADVPEGDRAAVQWLKEHSKPGDGFFIDFLWYWEWMYRAHVQTPSNDLKVVAYPFSYLYGSIHNLDPVLERKITEQTKELSSHYPEDSPGNYFNQYISYQPRAHQYIAQMKPRWFILIGKDRYKGWMEKPWIKEQNFSVVYPFTGSGPRSPEMENSSFEVNLKYAQKRVLLKKVFSTKNVEIFESTWN